MVIIFYHCWQTKNSCSKKRGQSDGRPCLVWFFIRCGKRPPNPSEKDIHAVKTCTWAFPESPSWAKDWIELPRFRKCASPNMLFCEHAMIPRLVYHSKSLEICSTRKIPMPAPPPHHGESWEPCQLQGTLKASAGPPVSPTSWAAAKGLSIADSLTRKWWVISWFNI